MDRPIWQLIHPIHVLVCSLLACFIALPASVADAQSTITLSLSAQYAPLSFGRRIAFTMEPQYASGNGLNGATLVVTLPPGVTFVSADQNSYGQLSVISVTGDSSSGQQVTMTVGQVNSNQLVFTNFLSVSVDQSVPDGTGLQATVRLTGTLSASGTPADSGAVPLSFQAGYLPVRVYMSSYGATCSGQVQPSGPGSSFTATSDTGQAAAGSATSSLDQAIGGLAAIASGLSDSVSPSLPAAGTPVQVGTLTNARSRTFVGGIGASALARGGYALSLNPDSETFGASALQASTHCSMSGLQLSFSNPNPYSVPLAVDARQHVFLATGDQAATDPFGFPGIASTSLTVGDGNVTDLGGEGGTSTIVERQLDIPDTADCSAQDPGFCRYNKTIETSTSTSCFSDDTDRCDFSPPSDTTRSTSACVLVFSGTGCDLVPPGDSSASTLEFPGLGIDVSGNSRVETDASTGAAILIRTGFGTGSGAASLRIYRGDADLHDAQLNETAALRFTAAGPVQVTVTDASGRRVGFQAAPAPTPDSPQIADARPAVFAEIPGASYSGLASDPQVLVIPDPKPGTYQAVVKAPGDPAFALTIDSVRVDGSVIDSRAVNGTVTETTPASFSFIIDENGAITTAGNSTGGDTVPPSIAAQVSPAPNSAGWNNTNVDVTLTATDNAGGAGVKEITYSATGAQTMSSTTLPSSTTMFTINAEGQTSISFSAADNAGNATAPQQISTLIDRTGPTALCASPDGHWHAANVSVACTAADALSGLASAADGSFALTTFVPAGMETANASTGTRTLCDVADNCANAGPIGGNMIDRKPPTISISAPTSGTYLVNQQVTASYACTDAGSGVASCAGDAPNGLNISTASAGGASFTVNATDNVGNAATPASVSYVVAYKVCALYDASRAVQSGSTIALKLQLCDANAADVSSASTIVHATDLVQIGTDASASIQASGNANPDNDFRYDATLGATGGYIFNLSTRGLSTGTYVLSFVAGADPTRHSLTFQVR